MLRRGGRLAWLAGMVLAASAMEAQAQLTLRFTVPAATPQGAAVHVAGTFNSWRPDDPAFRLSPERDGTHRIILPAIPPGPVEFKLTLGSWARVETDASGRDVPNRTAQVPDSGAAEYRGAVAGWRDRPRPSTARRTVRVLADSFAIPQLGRSRRVWIYLPPDYATSGRRYPVLYMHDGQNVFDDATSFVGEWGVDETLDSLHAAGDPGVIVVAVDHGGHRRLHEYSPWRNARYGGGEGVAYVDFLARTLKPYVDRRFRTLAGRETTAVAGSSMGGLISLYAALRHPDVFGGAGVFSPAFWFAPQIYDQVRSAGPALRGTRVYMVTGAREGDQPEVYVRDHERMAETLAALGYADTRLVAVVRGDGRHSETFWRREFPAAYRWLFRRTAAGRPQRMQRQ